MRQTRWPGFKANFCQLREGRRAEGAAQQGVTWHCAELLVHKVLGRPVFPYNSMLGISVKILQQSLAWSPPCPQTVSKSHLS